MCQLWRLASREPIARSSHEALLSAHSWAFLHTLSHTTLIWIPPKYKVSKYWITSKLARNKEALLSAHFWTFFTLSHTVSVHESHLNTGFLNAELQVNWHGIKLTKWLIKFNLTPTFKHLNDCSLLHPYSCSDSHLMNHSFKISHLVRRIINHCSVPPI